MREKFIFENHYVGIRYDPKNKTILLGGKAGERLLIQEFASCISKEYKLQEWHGFIRFTFFNVDKKYWTRIKEYFMSGFLLIKVRSFRGLLG